MVFSVITRTRGARGQRNGGTGG